MSFRMDQSDKQNVDSKLTGLAKVPLLLVRKQAPSMGYDLYDALCPTDLEHLWTTAKTMGLESMVESGTSFTFKSRFELPNLEEDTKEGKPTVEKDCTVEFTVPENRIEWAQRGHNRKRIRMGTDHSMYPAFQQWAVQMYEADMQYRKDSSLITSIVEGCGSIGQVKRLIPDVFDYLPQRFVNHAAQYQRKPRLPDGLCYLEDPEYSELMEGFRNRLTVGKLFEEQTDGVDSYHSEYPDLNWY